MHSLSSPPPNWLWRGTVEIASPPCGGQRALRLRVSFHRPEERDLFTTAKLASRTGEQAKPETPRGLSALRRGALPLSYWPTSVNPTGFEPATPAFASEVTDLFTTDAATCIQGNERHGSGTLANEEIRAFTTWNLKLSFVSP
jgi:hypothetical protein